MRLLLSWWIMWDYVMKYMYRDTLMQFYIYLHVHVHVIVDTDITIHVYHVLVIIQ